MKKKKQAPIERLLKIMADLRGPGGCPWDIEQDHMTLRQHAIEEVYELIDAIEAGDEHEMVEELGDLLLQVVFHCQMAGERKAFNFDDVCERLSDKLVRRHPHVFGDAKAKSVDAVWTQWEKIKKTEKQGTAHERKSALDGIPRHLPALLRAEKLSKKARKAGLMEKKSAVASKAKAKLASELFALAELAQSKGWSAEELLRTETNRREKALRRAEAKKA